MNSWKSYCFFVFEKKKTKTIPYCSLCFQFQFPYQKQFPELDFKRLILEWLLFKRWFWIVINLDLAEIIIASNKFHWPLTLFWHMCPHFITPILRGYKVGALARNLLIWRSFKTKHCPCVCYHGKRLM